MNPAEWKGVVARITCNWPHQLPPSVALAKWGNDLADLEAEQVHLAVEAIYREGREFPPNGAQVRAKLSELHRDDPSGSEAWQIANDPKLWGPPGSSAGLANIEARSPAVAAAIRRYGVDEFRIRNVADEGIARAQFRDIYRGVIADRARTDAYQGLDGSAKAIERANAQPRRLGETLREITAGRS